MLFSSFLSWPCPEISNINENNEKIINNEHEISKLIKALPKDIAALDKRFDNLLKNKEDREDRCTGSYRQAVGLFPILVSVIMLILI